MNTEKFDGMNITLYSYAELVVMKARHEAGRNKYSYAGPFTISEVEAEMSKRNLDESKLMLETKQTPQQ